MVAILEFLRMVIDGLFTFIVWLVIAYVAISWLVLFNIVNLRNPTVRGLVQALERIVAPLLWPFRKVIPSLGGMDLSPVLLVIVITAAQRALIPALFDWLVSLAGGVSV